MIQPHILITEEEVTRELASLIVLPAWGKTSILAFHRWNASSCNLAKSIAKTQELALLSNLPVILDEALLDTLIGLFIKGLYEPVLIIRRDRAGAPEAGLQVFDKDGIPVLDVTCTKVWSVAAELAEATVRDMAARIYNAAILNGIDCVSDDDLAIYLPEGHDLARPGKEKALADVLVK